MSEEASPTEEVPATRLSDRDSGDDEVLKAEVDIEAQPEARAEVATTLQAASLPVASAFLLPLSDDEIDTSAIRGETVETGEVVGVESIDGVEQPRGLATGRLGSQYPTESTPSVAAVSSGAGSSSIVVTSVNIDPTNSRQQDEETVSTLHDSTLPSSNPTHPLPSRSTVAQQTSLPLITREINALHVNLDSELQPSQDAAEQPSYAVFPDPPTDKICSKRYWKLWLCVGAGALVSLIILLGIILTVVIDDPPIEPTAAPISPFSMERLEHSWDTLDVGVPPPDFNTSWPSGFGLQDLESCFLYCTSISQFMMTSFVYFPNRARIRPNCLCYDQLECLIVTLEKGTVYSEEEAPSKCLKQPLLNQSWFPTGPPQDRSNVPSVLSVPSQPPVSFPSVAAPSDKLPPFMKEVLPPVVIDYLPPAVWQQDSPVASFPSATVMPTVVMSPSQDRQVPSSQLEDIAPSPETVPESSGTIAADPGGEPENARLPPLPSWLIDLLPPEIIDQLPPCLIPAPSTPAADMIAAPSVWNELVDLFSPQATQPVYWNETSFSDNETVAWNETEAAGNRGPP